MTFDLTVLQGARDMMEQPFAAGIGGRCKRDRIGRRSIG